MEARTSVTEKSILRKTSEQTHIEWSLFDFSITALSRCYKSPTFFINEIPLYLKLYVRSSQDTEFISIYITVVGSNREHPLHYTCMLKKCDGDTLPLHLGITEEDEKFDENKYHMIKRSDIIVEQNFELFPQNVLTVICCIMCFDIAQSIQPTASVKTRSTEFMNTNLLSEKIKGLFTSGEFCDVTLNVSDKEFKTHKAILAARSPVFATYFKHETMENQENVVNIPDCDPGSFQQFLEYLYSGKLESISFSSALHLYRTSHKYDVQELKTFCVEHMKRNFSAEFFFEAVALAELYEDKDLFSSAQDFFNRNLPEIFATAEWADLMKSNNSLANRLLVEMSSCVQVAAKRPRLE